MAACYYGGAKLGFALTFSPHPISFLWPPNSILLAALLLVPPRLWWVFLLAVFPAHMMAELGAGVPPTMALCWFVSNVSEAFIGAVGVRAMLRGRPAFDSVRGISAVIAGLVVAAFLSSFLDVALVRLVGWGAGDYWQLWRMRFFSNVLAGIAIVPAMVIWATSPGTLLRPTPAARVGEWACLLFGLVLACAYVFDVYPTADRFLLPALLYLPLPFMLWAAARFGPAGTSTAFVILTLVAILGASVGRGPFVGGDAAETVFSVQVFLIFVGITMLILSAVALERRRSEQDLRDSVAWLRRTEESLRRNDERFQLVLRATKDVIYDWNLKTGTFWWNSNGEEIFGRVRQRAGGGHDWRKRWLHPEDREGVAARLAAVMAGGGREWEADCRFRRLDGTYADVRERGFILRDESGAPLRMIGSLTDFTDHKRLEEANQRLAHVSRLAIAGELMASIAHEINQPLSAILSNAEVAELLLDEAVAPVDELRQIVADIRRDSMRAGDVVGRMRALLRRRELSMEPFDLNAAIEDVLDLVAGDLLRHGVTLDKQLLPLPNVRGDQVHLQQVVLNLILNSVDALGQAPWPRRLEIRTSRPETGEVQVSVSDSGPGISPDHAQQLFDSFFTTKPHGMGLGLSIARSIVEAHGGRIWAEARREGGARFGFSLPLRLPGQENR